MSLDATDDAIPHDTDGMAKRLVDQLGRMADAFDAIDELLHRLGVQGLQRMSAASADELAALGQTAHNAGLYAIERELTRLSTLVQRALGRDPLFEMAAYQATINRVWLINRRARARFAEGTLPEDMSDLIGVARRSYTPIDEPLELQALGADGWVSDTGFLGLTIHYAAADGRLFQAVAARPTMHFGTDPTRMLYWPAHDALEQTLGDLSHGAWRFDGAKASADARLSLHQDLRIRPAPYVGGRAYAALHAADWRAVVERLRAADVHPVGGGEAPLVYVEPAAVGPVEADVKRGRARAVARDEAGAQLDIEVPLRRENNLLVDNLERMYGPRRGEAAPPCDGLLGRVRVADDRVLLAPISGVWSRPLKLSRRGRPAHHTVHLSLESLEGARHA